MLKVLIADDERLIRTGITQSVDWARLGLRVVGSAENGLEACRMIREEGPDIVLLDVKMPGMSGLDVVAETSPLMAGGEYVILSGFGEFCFAQRALEMGVRHYLLKPVDRTLLEKTLVEVRDAVIRRRELETARASDSRTLAVSVPLARERLFEKCLEHELSEAERSLLHDGLLPTSGIILCMVAMDGCPPALASALLRNVEREVPADVLIGGAIQPSAVLFAFEDRDAPSSDGAPEAVRAQTQALLAPSAAAWVSRRGSFQEIRALTRDCRACLSLAPGADTDATPEARNELVSRVLLYLEEHYAEQSINLKWLARTIFHCHPDHLGKLFKAHVRVSFPRYLSGLRIERARRCLQENPTMPIHEVAYRNGFGYNVQYFSRVFKDLTGTAPIAFRSRLR